MRMKLQPYEKIKSVLRSSMAKERMYNLALLNTDLTKWTLQTLLILFTDATTRKRLF